MLSASQPWVRESETCVLSCVVVPVALYSRPGSTWSRGRSTTRTVAARALGRPVDPCRARTRRTGSCQASPKMRCERRLLLQRRVSAALRAAPEPSARREARGSSICARRGSPTCQRRDIDSRKGTRHLISRSVLPRNAIGALRLHSAPQGCPEDAGAALQPCRGIMEATASAACPFFANKARTTS